MIMDHSSLTPSIGPDGCWPAHVQNANSRSSLLQFSEPSPVQLRLIETLQLLVLHAILLRRFALYALAEFMARSFWWACRVHEQGRRRHQQSIKSHESEEGKHISWASAYCKFAHQLVDQRNMPVCKGPRKCPGPMHRGRTRLRATHRAS